MKILVEHKPAIENTVILQCAHLDEEMLEILSYLKERITKIAAHKDDGIFLLLPEDVFYAESVDGKTFLYSRNDVLETSESLLNLETKYANMGYIRISKSQIVNIRHIQRLLNQPERKIEITLINDEKLIVSRHYTQALRQRLGIQ